MRGKIVFVATGILGLAMAAVVPQVAPSSPRGPAATATADPLAAGNAATSAAGDDLPVSFVENRGQTDARVDYYAQGPKFGFYVTSDEVVMSLDKGAQPIDPSEAIDQVVLALRFVGSDQRVQPHGAELADGVVNDLRGNDPSQWRTGIAQYRDVVYRDLWPDIDLRLLEQAGVLKYEFHVHPGATPSDIRLAYDGADDLAVGVGGGLQIATAFGVLDDSAPVSYQEIGASRVPVASAYVIGGATDQGRTYSFAVGEYAKDHDLIIDPGVQYTTFLGGNSAEVGNGIVADSGGNVFVAGTTQSPDFPTTTGAFRRTGATSNFSDVFVTKLNSTGTAPVYSTFVGGSDLETGNRLAVDAAGNAYVTGTTKSSNFPTTGGAFDRSLNIPANCPRCVVDNTDSFVFKLNAAGSALSYSTYLGGTDIDSARGIAVDAAGSAYVTGETLSNDFPTTAGAVSRTLRGDDDVFVTKLNPTGSALSYSTFLGGTAVDNGERIAVDAGGNAYALGFSSSTDFPTTPGAFDTTANGGFDTTLTKLNPAGSALVYSTYLGGSDFDSGSGLAVDSAGSAYVTGGTPSANWPITPGAFDTTFNGGDGYVTKVDPAGARLVYSTFIGGSAGDSISSVVVDPAGNAWLTGSTSSADFPVTADAPDATFDGAGDAIISELDPTGSALRFSTFEGGSQGDAGLDITRDPTGDVYITGSTFSQDFPATVGAFDRVWNGDLTLFWGDAFVTKLDIDATTSTPPAPPAVPDAPTLVSPANGSSQPQPITFDWNDAAGAVSYTIQIDDSSAFTAPLVREQSVTTSMAATTGLAATTHFWRVRGVNSAGVAGAWSAVRSFTPQQAPPAAELSTMSTNPSTVVGGNQSSGTVVLTVGATDATVISLSSSDPAVASVPATTTVPANGFTGTFPITTFPVTTSTPVTITATYNGATRTAPLTVTPAAAGVVLQSVTISPSTIAGGTSTSAVVTLSGGAPTGGATVLLSSSNPAAAGVPASVIVGAGTTTAGFAISTTVVSATTSVTISATYAGVTRTATATITPAAPPPPPANVTVTVTASGRGGERIVSTPTGVSVATGASGSTSFAAGTAVVLRVSSGRDAIFSGACSSGGSKVKSCTFTAAANSSVNVNVQ